MLGNVHLVSLGIKFDTIIAQDEFAGNRALYWLFGMSVCSIGANADYGRGGVWVGIQGTDGTANEKTNYQHANLGAYVRAYYLNSNFRANCSAHTFTNAMSSLLFSSLLQSALES
mmetsp:Transcript_12848/g.23152  ORF Transcript_12848/g.23152 Transcript_12848/m.23152 type:complete len:115 (+) Transcript_12848:765-1109(+)